MKDHTTPSRLVRGAFLASHCLHVPCWTLLTLLNFILYKTSTISPWYLTVLIAIPPLSGALAPYWSQAIHRRPDRLMRNLLYTQLVRYIPLVLLPWIHSPLWVLCSYGLLMTMQRACVPAWMELIKRHLNEEQRVKLLSQAHMIDYIGPALLSIPFAWLLDLHEELWREIIAIAAAVGLSSIISLCALAPLTPALPSEVPPTPSGRWLNWNALPALLSTFLLKPWKESLSILKQEPDFARYLFGFMLGGAGLMIVKPALPSFFVDTLHLSYTEMGCVIALCRAVGSLSSPLWSRAISLLDFSLFSSLVTAVAMFFPLCMLGAKTELAYLYLAYFLYGVMQAGSELSWHLSGVLFAKEKESSVFSTTNVLMVGLRGCFIPALGACLLTTYGAGAVLWMGMSLSCAATCYFLHTHTRRTLEVQS